MRIALTVLLFSVLTFGFGLTRASAQDVSCSCADTPENTCKGTVTCPDGCTAVCGAGEICYLSCSTDLLLTRISVRFVKKSGKAIALTLSDKVKKRISFEPYPNRANKRYTYQLKNSDLWPILWFLNRHGKVTINDMDFRTFVNIQRQATGRRLSVRFERTSVQKAVEKLAFLSRFQLRIKSGDPSTRVSLHLNDKTLSEIIKEISTAANVKIEMGKYQRR